MLLRPVGATPGSPPVAVWSKGRPPSTACAANRGTTAGVARRRHSKRLLPGWGARCAGWGRNHPAGEPNHRALRTPPSARPLHAGLASAGDETLQGIRRRVAGALHPRDERRPIPFGPPGAEGSGHPLEGNGSGTRFVFGLPGVHRSRPGPRVDLARTRCGRIVHLWPRDGLLCAGDDARWAATRSRDPRASRLDSRGRSETRGFGHGDQGKARARRPFFGKSRTGETSDEGLNPSKNAVTRRRRIVEIDRAVSFDVVRERASSELSRTAEDERFGGRKWLAKGSRAGLETGRLNIHGI